jgi:glycosyltransferase involved in cell wall biosynthesis
LACPATTSCTFSGASEIKADYATTIQYYALAPSSLNIEGIEVPVQKISLVVASLSVGGAERHTLTLTKMLNPALFSTEIIPLKDQGGLKAEARQLDVEMWTPAAKGGIDFGAAQRLAKHWEQRGVDAIVAANSYAYIVAWMATRMLRRRPRLYCAWHSAPEHMRTDRRGALLIRVFRWLLKSADGLIYVSRLQMEAWEAKHFAPGVPSTCVLNGIDVERYSRGSGDVPRESFGWDSSAFVVGMCASLRKEKRVEDLLVALRVMIARGVPARLLLVGDGPERVRLEALATDLIESGAVVFAGFQPDVRPYIEMCDVMALVSDAEAFSISVLESMACAKPVVLTDVGGASEQIQSGVHGFIVPTRCPEGIADRLESLYQSGSGFEMGQRARERVGLLFSLDKMIARYEGLLSGELAFDSEPRTKLKDVA